MCGFLGGKVPFLDVILPWSRPSSLRAAPLFFHQARTKTIAECGLLPEKTGAYLRGNCERTDSEKEIIFMEL